MKKQVFTILENCPIADRVFKMALSGDTGEITRPGQFVNIELDGLYLRRPISVCDVEDGRLTLIYKSVGVGTEKMSALKKGDELDILTGLGNGYDLSRAGESPLLVGGGVGVPPLFLLCKRLVSAGKKPVAVLGFNTSSEVFFAKEFAEAGAEVYITTVDGSLGTRGFVTDAVKTLEGRFDYTFACGPEVMMKALYSTTEVDGQYSFEERMGCGFGVCMGCSCETKYGSKRICRDGPVLERGEIIW